jgi:DNA repair photolyase
MYYQGMIGITSQFVDCGNCFRLDSYKGCTFGCRYCFANNRSGGYRRDFRVADPKRLRKWMTESFGGNASNLRNDFLSRRVPLHFGGMSDPFCAFEWQYGITYEMLLLSKEFSYPMNISTKFGGILPDQYWDVLDPKIHTFSISLMGLSESYVRFWEKNSPSVADRLDFIRELKRRGFWVGVRIQPIIDIDECCGLVRYLCGNALVDMITVEHLKLIQTNGQMCKELFPLVSGKIPFVQVYNEYRVRDDVRVANIERIKSISTVPVGVGDDGLHHMSDTLNCCGLDIMPEAFYNWHKYNTMYIGKTGDVGVYCSEKDCNRCFNPNRQKAGCVTMKDYVDLEMNKHSTTQDELCLF